jgi:hypothetical protein
MVWIGVLAGSVELVLSVLLVVLMVLALVPMWTQIFVEQWVELGNILGFVHLVVEPLEPQGQWWIVELVELKWIPQLQVLVSRVELPGRE